MMSDSLTLFILMILVFLGLLYIPAFMVRRAIFKVISIFCWHHAITAQNAKTIDELGLNPPDFFQKLWRPRDDKPYALQILRQKGIIFVTEDRKLYMVEDKLDERLRGKRSY